MRKFLAVVKREYLQRVRAKMFIVSTVLLPAVMSLFGIVPALILNIEAGGPLRVAVIDQTEKMYAPLEAAFLNEESEETDAEEQASPPPEAQNATRRGRSRMGSRTFQLTEVKLDGRSIEKAKAELDRQLRAKQLDGYLILAPDFMTTGQAEFLNNNPGDVLTQGILTSSLTRALREQRLVEANVDQETRKDLFKRVNLQVMKVG